MARSLDLALCSSGAALALFAAACGGGVPLLHGAHALSPGKTLTGVGFSGTFTAGAARDAMTAARTSDPSTPGRDELLAKDAAVTAALAPSVAPFVAMRIGLGGDNEVGFAYTGRFLRFDARHAFESGKWAFSAGAGARGSLNAANAGAESDGAASSPRAPAYGFDVPLLVGWRSAAGVVSLWGGARGGLDRIHSGSNEATPGSLNLTHWRAGGVVGLAIGFRHVHAAIELETSYHGVKGTFGSANVEVRGVTLTPAGGLLFTF